MIDAWVPDVMNREPYSDGEMADMASPVCEDCGGEVPSFQEHGLEVTEDGRHLCADCSRVSDLGGYHIDVDGERIYG